MNDACAVGVDARESVANRVRDQLLKKSLTELADPRSVQNRYPPEMFMQRSHTYVPGGEVYTEVILWPKHIIFVTLCYSIDCLSHSVAST